MVNRNDVWMGAREGYPKSSYSAWETDFGWPSLSLEVMLAMDTSPEVKLREIH